MNEPTWRNLPKRQYYQKLSEFARLDLNRLDRLKISELALLLQWAFHQCGKTTINAYSQADHFDLELVDDQDRTRQEYARVYLKGPIDAVYCITTQLKGRKISKIYLFTLKHFSIADKNAQKEYPLFLELRECDDIIRMVRKAQTQYHKSLHPKHDDHAAPEHSLYKNRVASFWAMIKRMFSK